MKKLTRLVCHFFPSLNSIRKEHERKQPDQHILPKDSEKTRHAESCLQEVTDTAGVVGKNCGEMIKQYCLQIDDGGTN